MRKIHIYSQVVKLVRSALLVSLATVLGITGTVHAVDTSFFGTNDIIYYDPDTCSTGPATGAGGNVAPYTNPVYKGNAPDPSAIFGDDGQYHVFATGNVHLTSPDLVNWKKVNNGWNLKGPKSVLNEAGGAKWGPNVVKLNSKYILTYVIPTGTPEIGGGGHPSIAYATADSLDGPFNYKGKLSLPDSFTIDPQIFIDDDGKSYFLWGGGYFKISEFTFDGDQIKLTGPKKELLTKAGVGSPNATIESPWLYKHSGWYYLMYSQGHWDINNDHAHYPYQVAVARSKSPMGPFKPDDKMNIILKGNDTIKNPGTNSVITDASGNDWIVYSGYYGGDKNTRSLMIDPITYSDDWPAINGPSTTQQQGTTGAAAQTSSPGQAATGQVKVAQANIMTSTSAKGFKDQLDKVIATNPDFVSGNEWTTSDASIKRPGYDFYKNNDQALSKATAGESSALAIMWRTDRWSKVDAGIERITLDSDVDYKLSNVRGVPHDGKRAVIWVTLQDKNGGKISFMSTHLPVNPNKYQPTDKRKILYQKGADRIAEKIKELEGIGPVILAGDLNAQIGDDGPWHPRQAFGNAGMEAVVDALPNRPKGLAVDYIFYSKQDVRAISQEVPFHLTDHPFYEATLEITGGGAYTGTSAGSCVCSTTDASSAANVPLVGSDNQEKAFNYFVSKGLSAKQSAAILGNMMHESGVDPENIENGKMPLERSKDPKDAGPYGWGIIQWTPGSKILPAAKVAAGGNGPIYELGTQLNIVWGHMQNKPTITRGDFSMDDFKKIDSIDKAVDYFEYHIEGAGIVASQDRKDNANAIYNRYGDKTPVQGSTTSTPTSDSVSSTDACGDTEANSGDASLGMGKGDFTDSGKVANYNTVLHNAQVANAVFGKKLYGIGWCATIVSRTWSNGKNSFGYGDPNEMYAKIKGTSKFHADKKPKAGAILIYSGAGSAHGHTTIYLGNNKILNDGWITDAKDADGWGGGYVGWVDPNDLGWKTSSGTNESIKNAVISGIKGNGGAGDLPPEFR